jgi:hypothetical protein
MVKAISDLDFRYGRAPSPQAFTGATAKFNMAPNLVPRACDPREGM